MVNIRPKVDISECKTIVSAFILSFLCPFFALLIWGTGVALSRSGSLMVGLAVAAQFGQQIRSDFKHINNANRAWHKDDDDEVLDFSNTHRLLSIIAIALVLSGTVIWGFGEEMIGD